MNIEKEHEYLELLKALVQVVDANKGTPAGPNDRFLDAEGLALKVVAHAASALHLLRSTTLPEIGVSFFDPASVIVLCRAAMESFLVFYYVFNEPKSDDERDFRFFAWKLAGLQERQSYPAISLDGQKILLANQATINLLTQNLQNNSLFKNLSQDQRKKLLKKLEQGKWKLKFNKTEWNNQSWTDIALSAGLNEIHAKAFYRYLCGYAHSGNLSICQIHSADSAGSQKALSSATVSILMIVMANMIKLYCAVFPCSRTGLVQDEASKTVERWVRIGASSINSSGNVS